MDCILFYSVVKLTDCINSLQKKWLLKTKSVHDKIEKTDGLRILVMRYWPRPYSREKLKIDRWEKNLSPSKKLLKDWRQGRINWDDYVISYFEEMHAATKQEKIRALAEESKSGRTITLICKELSEEHCHKEVMKSHLKSPEEVTE